MVKHLPTGQLELRCSQVVCFGGVALKGALIRGSGTFSDGYLIIENIAFFFFFYNLSNPSFKG